MTLDEYVEEYGRRVRSGKELSLVQEEMRQWMRDDPPSPEEVCSFLRDVKKNPDLEKAATKFDCLWFNLRPEYVPLLNDILSDDEHLKRWHWPVLLALDELADPRSIPALTKAVGYRYDYDPMFSIPKRALEALAYIDTPEAKAVLEQALTSDEFDLRRIAHSLLDLDFTESEFEDGWEDEG